MELLQSILYFFRGILKRFYYWLPFVALDVPDLWQLYLEPFFSTILGREIAMPATLTSALVAASLVWAAILTYHELRNDNLKVNKELESAKTQDLAIIWLDEEEYWEEEKTPSFFMLQGSMQINTIKRRLVSSVELDLSGNLHESNWKEEEIYTSAYAWGGIVFKIATKETRGRQRASLRLIVDGKEEYSDSFVLTLPSDIEKRNTTKIEPPVSYI